MRVACIQMTSGPDIAANTHTVCRLIEHAHAQGAEFILTPENTCHILSPSTRKKETAQSQDNHSLLKAVQAVAKKLRVNICIGSLTIRHDDHSLANRSFMIDDRGDIIATYDKIHLFDVDLPNGERHRESDLFTAGDRAVVTQVKDARLGMSICYDLRFAHLYRDMAKAGADILLIPSAFTVPTGRAHWEVLLRARAIETGCFVMAAAQVGTHDGGRQTWGHSMIISPWGDIIAHQDEGEGIILADLDLSKVVAMRGAIPALAHDRPYTIYK